MNARVITSSFLALFWLSAGIYLLIAYPQLRSPVGQGPRVFIGWIVVVLMLTWNIVRTILLWKPPRQAQQINHHGD